MTNRPIRTAFLALLLAGAAPAALAQAQSTAPVVGGGISQEQALALSARLDALEQQNRELQDQIADLKAQTTAGDQAIREQVEATTVSLANGRPTFASGDGQFTASLRGVFQLDAAHYDQDRAGPLASDFRRGSLGDATESDRARDLGDGANFRRARIGIEGRAFGDWNYNFLYDFGGSGNEEAGRISAAWLEYAAFPKARLRIGAFSPPSGIEEATSTNGSLFVERASPSELVRSIASGDGRTAIGLFGNGDRWNYSAAFSGNIVGTQTFDEQLAFVGRVAYVPMRGPDYLVHLGANTEIVINPAKSGPEVAAGVASPLRLRDRPEIRVDGTRLVDTGNIDADGLTAWGLEFAAQRKNLHVQAEYYGIEIDRRASALADPSFDGWYVQGAWTITGQPRRYSIATATFDSPRGDPFSLKKRTWGVWELAARYSDLDLNYLAGSGGAQVASAVRGGEQKIITLGLNWYPNQVVRFQAAWQHVDVDRLSPGGTAFGAGALTPPAGAQIGQEFDIWSLRTQYAF
ncbi:porin [Phenylobacterium sp.]|jgi:phosphate-selective porin OprO/OprP|uniref:porin n=1 Tax=Phenylobacterium sp. TaxID=1871053 RepID=UPI002F942C97